MKSIVHLVYKRRAIDTLQLHRLQHYQQRLIRQMPAGLRWRFVSVFQLASATSQGGQQSRL